jgi:hypothetical protein
MSCGNRFQCGITRFQKHSFTPDKPSNQELHNENQKRLSDLMKAREEIDKQFLSSNVKLSESSAMTIHCPELLKDTPLYSQDVFNNITTSNNFTPWKIPSATDYQTKPK